MKVYVYNACDTCRKAIKWLDAKSMKYEAIPIVDQPPTMTELKAMLEELKANGGSIKNLFNTSGVQYREMKISDKLKAGMTESESLSLLAKNGKLIKRPFLISNKAKLVGFKEDEWKKALS